MRPFGFGAEQAVFTNPLPPTGARGERLKSRGYIRSDMVNVQPPSQRECLRCGRRDTWSDAAATWVAVEEDGECLRGRPHCLHDWNINGSFNPVAE